MMIGSIEGQVTEDEDNDNLGDSPLSDVVISLLDESGTLVATTSTDSNGAYIFVDVPQGTYTVTETNPEDYLDVSDIDGGDPNAIAVVVVGEQLNSTGNDFVDEVCREISGTVSEDVDNDNNGDQGMLNVVVSLFAEDGTLVDTTSTDSAGAFVFECVKPGVYSVVEQTPDGFVDVSDSDGGDPNTITVDTSEGDRTDLEFVDEQPSEMLSASPSSPPSVIPGAPPVDSSAEPSGAPVLGSISGNVSEDTNNDDVGDDNLDGVLIELEDAEGNTVATTMTDSSGSYVFYDLPEGSYTVKETNLPDFLDVSDIDGGDPNIISVVIGGDEPINATGRDFVDEICRKIDGEVLEDVDNNDTGDRGISDVVVQLYDLDGNLVSTTSTDSDGAFEFVCVEPGDYQLREQNPEGYYDVGDSDNGDPNEISVSVSTSDSLGNEFIDELPSAAPSVSATPSLKPTSSPSLSAAPSDPFLGSISGNVSEDINNDDLGEDNLSGVPIELRDRAGETVATTLTDSVGNYAFYDLPAGEYTVIETNLEDFLDVSDIDGGDPNIIRVPLEDGENSTGNDFVDEVCRKIAGLVQEDIDNDDRGEMPIKMLLSSSTIRMVCLLAQPKLTLTESLSLSGRKPACTLLWRETLKIMWT